MLDELPDVFDAPDPSIFTSMLEYEGLDCDRELYLTGKCFLLLSSLRGYKRVVNESKYAGSSRYARAAAIFVVTSYMYPITVEKLAENLHVNRRYLSRVFKKEYGVTVKEYITLIRMDHAKTLLHSGRTVAETALLCGYNDTLGFSKMYRKHHGCPPSAERAPEQQIPAAETDIFNSTEPSRTEVYRDSYDRAKTSDVRDSAASAQALNPHAPAEPTQPENRTPTESARPENHTPAESARPENRAPAEPAQPADIPPSEAPLSDTPSGVPESGHTAALEQEKISNDR